MAAEVTFTIDWQVWVPIGIAALSLIFSIRQARRSSKRDCVADLEKKVDRALKALDECEDNLKQCGHEKDELRREKYALLERIAGASQSAPAPSSDG